MTRKKAVEILKQKRKYQEKQQESATRKKMKNEEERLAYEISHEQEEILNLKQKSARASASGSKPCKGRMSNAKRNTGQEGAAPSGDSRFFWYFSLLSIFGKTPWYIALLCAVFLAVVCLLPLFLPGTAKSSAKDKAQQNHTGRVKIQERLSMLEENLRERQRKLENLQEEYEEARENRGEILVARKEIQSLLEAEQRIREATARMQKKTGGTLQKKLSQNFLQSY